MNILQSIRTAYRGLVGNKLRSALTLLGIMIGVAAVVGMISIGAGASAFVTSQIRALGSNLLIVVPGSAGGGFGGARQAAGTGTNLAPGDADAISKEVAGVRQVSPEFSSQAQVVYKDQNINTSVNGVTPVYEDVHNFHVLYGDFLSNEDQNVGSTVAVLGQNVVSELFGQENPIGKTLKIKNVPFRVVGIMESKGQAGFENLDDAIFIPLSTAQKRLLGVDYLRVVNVAVATEDQMTLASNEITALLLSRHKIQEPSQADFSVRSQADILSAVSQVTGTMTILLGGIAAISLLVGGIGIMNIMLVSVTERTREIGLRKAVGARSRDILGQFLMEAVVLSMVGGVVGLLVGWLIGIGIANYGGWTPVFTLNSVFLAFLFSAGVGVFFGVYPARRASRLNPIEALRFE